MVEIETHISNKTASEPADAMAPVHVDPKSCIPGTFKNNTVVSLSFPVMYPHTDHN